MFFNINKILPVLVSFVCISILVIIGINNIKPVHKDYISAIITNYSIHDTVIAITPLSESRDYYIDFSNGTDLKIKPSQYQGYKLGTKVYLHILKERNGLVKIDDFQFNPPN